VSWIFFDLIRAREESIMWLARLEFVNIVTKSGPAAARITPSAGPDPRSGATRQGPAPQEETGWPT